MGKHKGFTLIEVILFLAVTAALFAGIAVGMNNVLTHQQYNDSTQDFFEFMRSIYSQVSNPESPNRGNSTQAMYGKLVVFGETKNLSNKDVASNGNSIFTYEVVGDVLTADDPMTGDVQTLLNKLHAQVMINKVNASGNITSSAFASASEHQLRWNAAIEKTASRSMFRGALLVVRHPKSGVINTLFSTYGTLFTINEDKNTCNGKKSPCLTPGILSNRATGVWKKFEAQEVVICLNPAGLGNTSTRRQTIKIEANARNASGVQIMDTDASGSNACN